MKVTFKRLFAAAIVILVAMAVLSSCTKKDGVSSAGGDTKTYKVFHVMSYHSPWKWTDDQLAGFKEALKDLNVEYKVVQMDTKNTNTTADQKKAAGQKILAEIEAYGPDLIYTNDDDAQAHIGKYLVNKGTPYVFSGVNASPDTYGFVGSQNVAGVLEEMHFVPSVRLLQQIDPSIKKIAVISEPGGFWDSVTAKMKEADEATGDIEIVAMDFVTQYSDYQTKMKQYANTADAVCLLGIFNLKDAQGANVSFDTVIQWTVENSKIPDFSYWRDRIEKGTFASMTVSGYEQGLAAGKLAYKILKENKSPDSFAFKPTVKGEPIVSLARAKKLGLQLGSELLLTAEAIEDFNW